MQTLKESCRNKFRMMFEGLKTETNAMTFILVTDDFTLKILSSFMKMMELVNFGITAIEKLTLKRKKFHKIDAIYLLSENEDSLTRLLNDYQTEDNAQYGIVHIFFTTRIASATMDRIAGNETLLKRVRTFKELNLEFLCATQNEFQLDIFPSLTSFKYLYSGSGALSKAEEKSAVERLATIVVSFPKFYGVEILYNASPVQNIAEKIAKGLEIRLVDMYQEFGKARCESFDPKANKITVVVLDRSYDPASPLLHDFHYLSLLSDLKDIKDFKASYSDGQAPAKLLDLDENDEIYTKYRYKHIAELMSGLSKDFQDFLKTNSAAKLERGETENLNAAKLGELMKNIPQYNDIKEKYSMHTKLITELFDTYKQRNLLAVGDLEQTIITGVNPKGAPEPDKVIYANLLAQLAKEKDSDTKARLLGLGLMYLDVSKPEKQTLDGMLAALGPKYLHFSRGLGMLTGGQTLPKFRENKDKPDLILDRHQPKIEAVLGEVAVRGTRADLRSIKINTDDKGILNDRNVLVRKKIGREDQLPDNPKIIVCFVGGLGFNEIRCINKFSNKFIMVSGSNQLLTPSNYIKELNTLATPEQQL